jgi:hypothetical protein
MPLLDVRGAGSSSAKASPARWIASKTRILTRVGWSLPLEYQQPLQTTTQLLSKTPIQADFSLGMSEMTSLWGIRDDYRGSGGRISTV